MKEFKLLLNGTSCNSCEKLIDRIMQTNNATVKSINVKSGELIIETNEESLSLIKEQLAQKGFSEKNLLRGDPKRIKKYVSEVLSNASSVEVESKLVKYAASTFFVFLVLLGIGYFSIKNIVTYLPLILLAIIAVIMTTFSSFHMKAYVRSLSCTNGMMIGMTMGMATGFMSGSLIGATNGMFFGSIIGMSVGIGLGMGLGRYCGTMAAMEGIMAGLMAGTMGAMLSVMMINDNLMIFLYIFFGICTFILGGLSYMMYRESGAAPKTELEINFGKFILLNFIFVFLIVTIMLYGPKNGIVLT